MDYCPRCGGQVPSYAMLCPHCGLRRAGGPPQQVPPEPPRRRGGLVIGLVTGLLVAALLTVGGLWWTDAGPFESQADTDPATPAPPTEVVTITAPTPSAASTPTPTPTPTPTEGASGDFSEMYARVHQGVGLVSVQMCQGSATGSGFLVDDSTVVTAAHVVAGATDLNVDFDGNTVDAAVRGVNQEIDLAVLSLSEPVDAPAFTLADEDPGTGTHVAVIGFPLDEPKSLTEGTISGQDRDIITESGAYEGLLQTDAAINPGNSGGPLLNDEGEVVGIADAIRTDAQGIGYAVPVSLARPGIESGAGLMSPESPPCMRERDPVRVGVRQTLQAYLDAINAGDYGAAMSLVSPQIRDDSNEEQWRSDYATTWDDLLQIQAVSGPSSAPSVWATFRSQQNPGYGPEGARDATCLIWSIDYEMARSGGGYIITKASGHGSEPYVRCD